MSNTQRKLDKARPPRVHITYDVEIGGENNQKELPLVIGVIGHFSHDDQPLRHRKFVKIDNQNFNDVMLGMNPEINFLAESVLPGKEGKLPISLSFNLLDDFSPESIALQVDPLRNLLELREQLSDLRNRTASNEQLKDRLLMLIESSQADDAVLGVLEDKS